MSTSIKKDPKQNEWLRIKRHTTQETHKIKCGWYLDGLYKVQLLNQGL